MCLIFCFNYLSVHLNFNHSDFYFKTFSMSKNISTLSQREEYTSALSDKFLWWLSTAEKELILPCVVDRNRYKIIGMTVLATWGFATLAWTYFWTTITDNWFFSVALGLFMGFIILTIDRALIKGMNKFNKNKILPLLLRSVLAITLGTFMAQPAILYMFDKEIKLQASLDNEGKKRMKQQQLDSLFSNQKTTLQTKREQLQQQLDSKYSEVSTARQQFLEEIDGTGGSGKIGIKNIALAKKMSYEKLDSDYRNMAAIMQPEIKIADSSLTAIRISANKENESFAALLNNGFLTRIEALNNLVKSNAALQWRYFLIVIILMLIELMPVLAKTLLPSGTYDEKVRLTEEMEKEISESNQQKETGLKQLYNSLSHENDEAFIREFFASSKKERNEKLLIKLEKWKTDQHQSFDDFWENLKKDMLTKQEN